VFSVLFLLAATACTHPAQPPGTITGTVSFTGVRPTLKQINIEEDAECVKLNPNGMYDESILVNKDGTLANVFVYVKEGLPPARAYPKPTQPVVLDQKGCRFSPRVFGIEAGQPFKVTNSDPVTHNVHPIAKMNREWNQSQSPEDPPIQRRFARPEMMVRIKCNIHNWMRSWAAVMDHPFYAVSGNDGSFTIPNLPPGDYVLEAWQESLGTRQQRVHVASSATQSVNFSFNGAAQ
jgi:hypothetical protein